MRRSFVLAVFVLAGCKENLLDDVPDASTDASIDALPLLPGDWSCAGTPYPSTAPDPLVVRGFVTNGSMGIGGATVEVHDATSDAPLAQAVTENTSVQSAGRYSMSIATGGTAPKLYRRISSANRLDSIAFDGIPVSSSYDLATVQRTDSETQHLYDVAGVARTLTKGAAQFYVFDCGIPPGTTRNVAGATVDVPPGATLVYMKSDGSLDPTLTATSTMGAFLLFNVTPGFLDLTIHAGPITYRSWPVRVYANSWTLGPRHP
jgi:hypothetical protein